MDIGEVYAEETNAELGVQIDYGNNETYDDAGGYGNPVSVEDEYNSDVSADISEVSEDWPAFTTGSEYPIELQNDDAVYHQLQATYEGEDVSRAGMGVWVHADPDVTTRTHYMSAEEREAYRLSANDAGMVVDSNGLPYDSGQDAAGSYPGSTGGNIFVLDDGGLFAAAPNSLQKLLNEQADEHTYEVVHHSSLAAGQRVEGDDSPLQVAAAGEIVTKDGMVRSISDASGHFLPETDQTMQMVDALTGAGVNLDNTSINLVGKPGYDQDGDVPAIDVYAGEFQAAEGDQRTLTNKRAVMDDLRGQFAGADPDDPYQQGLAQAELEAELRAASGDEDSLEDSSFEESQDETLVPGDQVLYNNLSDNTLGTPVLYNNLTDDPQGGVQEPLNAAADGDQDGDSASEGSLEDLEDGDSSSEESPSEWHAGQATQEGRSGFSLGGHRGAQAAPSQPWQAAEPLEDTGTGITIGGRRNRR